MPENIKSIRYRKFLSDHFPEIIVFLVFCSIQLININLDFWNDEIYTLKEFVFVPFSQTLTDYHSTNNHIFFNLINNLYLKIIGVDSLFSLMDRPYLLRILTFLYAIPLFIYTYKIGYRFFGRPIGLLAIILLTTTIPYFNFSLQIRGYGLSMLLLVMLIYYGLVFLETNKRKYLVWTTLLACLFPYTILSNLYPLGGLLFFLGLYFLITVFITPKKWNNKGKPFFLLLSVIAGTILSIGLYLPVLDDIFSISYIKSGVLFDISKLEFLIPRIVEGVISNRWFLMVPFVIGLLFNFKSFKSKGKYFFLFIFTCLIPLALIYFRGDTTPIRTLSVLVPLFCIMIAAVVMAGWRIWKKSPKYDLIFMLLVLIYSLFIFKSELNRISEKLLDDIIVGRRSKDLYFQYHSARYQPMSDIKGFLSNNYNPALPLIKIECQDHGISNYLEKFGLDFYYADSMEILQVNYDSFYIVTNYTNDLRHIYDAKTKVLDSNLTFHNFLLYYKNQNLFDKIENRLDIIKRELGDSVNFVFDISSPKYMPEYHKNSNSYFISNSNQGYLGGIIHFTASKPYICYVETVNRNSENIYFTLQDSHKKTVFKQEDPELSIHLFKVDSTYAGHFKELHFNGFEDNPASNDIDVFSDPVPVYSGMRSEKLDFTRKFSSTFSSPIHISDSFNLFKVSFMGRYKKQDGGLLVLEIKKDGEVRHWTSIEMANFHTELNEWNKITATFRLNELPEDDYLLSTYIWNPEKNEIWIDDFKVEVSK